MGISRYCASLDDFLCVKFEISLKTQENSSKSMNCTERSRSYQNLDTGFSLNFPDINTGTRLTYCARLDEFLCAKFEISLFSGLKCPAYGSNSLTAHMKLLGLGLGLALTAHMKLLAFVQT